MLQRLKTQLKTKLLEGEISTIKMKLEVPGSLARADPNWRNKLLDQLRDKEEELMEITS